ncbi:hypothetical protein H0H92_015238, partial [Tricholoma furcatifolium]
ITSTCQSCQDSSDFLYRGRLSMALDNRMCSGCKHALPLDASHFQGSRDGFSKTCISCLNKEKHRAAEKKKAHQSNKENTNTESIDEGDTEALLNLPVMNLENFLDSLAIFVEAEDVVSLDARVSVSSIVNDAPAHLSDDKKLRFLADSCAEKIWKLGKYRFV